MDSATVDDQTETTKTWSDDQAAEMILLCLSKRMESVKMGCNTHALETAINLLRDALDTGKYTGELLSWIRVLIIQGLLTRFGLHGWIEDLDACISVREDLEPGFKTSIQSGLREPSKSAVGLLMACRSSFDVGTLDKIIRIAERSISLYTGGASLRARFLNLCGNAWVMKYLHQWKAKNLQHAAANFQRAKDVSDGFVALKLISLFSLVQTGLLRYTECDQPEGLLQARKYMTNAREIGAEGLSLFVNGTRLAYSGIKSQRQQGIKLLYACLSHYAEPHPRRHLALHNLAKALYDRFEEEGDKRDLENCILLNEGSLELQPSPRPGRDSALGQLAGALYLRFRQLGDIQDLQKSILLQRESLELQRTPDPFNLSNMAKALLVRFRHQGSDQDLEEGIECLRKSTSLAPTSLLDSLGVRNDLASALCLRFYQKGTLQDIEESIILLREVLAAPPGSVKDYSGLFNNLAGFLMSRLRHLGTSQPDELEEIIKLHKQALKLRPRGNVNRPSSLNNLASALHLRYSWKGIVQDIKESIELHQEALDLRPEGHPKRYQSLINLANAIEAQESPNNISQVQYCIKLRREAVYLPPRSHPDYPSALYSLATTLFRAFKFAQFGLETLQECISLYERAVTLLKSPDPGRQMALTKLADALALRFDVQNEGRDIQAALQHYESAAKCETAPTLDRFFSSRKWARNAELYNSAVALDAYRYTMDLLPLLASLDLTLIQRRDLLRNTPKAVGDAAGWAICQDQLEVAVIFLSNSRSIFWSQALQLRNPVDELAVVHPYLANKFLTTSRELDLASHSSIDQLFDHNLDTTATDRQPRRIHTLAETRRTTIEKIRKIKGFEGFLKPPSFASLQVAAQRGPIVLLNTSARGCDALILRDSGPIHHIELSNINTSLLGALKDLAHKSLAQGLRAVDYPTSAIDIFQAYLLRDMVHQDSCVIQSNQEAFRLVLLCLWVHVVQPVVKALGIEKSDSPNRIWWCPTGHFASLPIHAAGIYSCDNDEPIDCLFQYAVSSYCTSPQDLLYDSPSIPPDFKMTVVVEPEVPGAPPLPGALCELVHIRRHIADNQGQMIARLGLRNTPSNINDLMSNIQQSSFVHFVCHGMQNLDNPLESYLLTGGGRLTISQIIKECRVPDGALAYLSACETAKTDEQQPDESLNLAATMMFAGFKGVVGTLWSIYDDDAPIVADTFYHHMFRRGAHAPPDVRDAAYGLHFAMNKLRESGKPFCSWVPYFHYGI